VRGTEQDAPDAGVGPIHVILSVKAKGIVDGQSQKARHSVLLCDYALDECLGFIKTCHTAAVAIKCINIQNHGWIMPIK